MPLQRPFTFLLRLRIIEYSLARRFSSIGDESTEKSLREQAVKVAQTTPNKDAVKKRLLERLTKISQESYLEATSSQYDELLSIKTKAKVIQRKPIIPSNASILRKSADASEAIRREAFSMLRNRGLSAEEANKRSELIYNKLLEEFKQKQMKIAEETRQQQDQKSVERFVKENEKEIYKYMLKELKRMFDSAEDHFVEYEYANNSEEYVEPKALSFTKTPKRLNIFDMDRLKANNLEFWKKWDEEKTEIVNQGMGPTNAFEEQILWTKQGKMWPYPIDNEYMLGKEKEVSFVDHIFLEPYWKKHKVPKSKAVEQFMELVLVGLSKNPYMPIEKKRAHIDWFANYFKEVIPGKYKEVL